MDQDGTAAQIAALTAVLATVDRTRSALPSLLRSFSVPATTSAERAITFRERANEAATAIAALRDGLENVAPLLDACDQSERADSVGIVVRKRDAATGLGWDRLDEVLGPNGSARGKEKEFVPQFGSPTTPAELDELLRAFEASNPSVLTTARLGRETGEPRELRVVVRGLMRAFCSLRWCDDHQGGRRVVIERVACFGLKEDRASYLQSQFSLFQTISNEAMKTVASSLRRCDQRRPVASSNVEEVLAKVLHPRVPF